MGEHEKTDATDDTGADQQSSTGTETAAEPDQDEVGPVSGGDDGEDAGASGELSTQPGADPEDAEQIEEERQERLDPDNRPENAEVDNSEREFDAEKGMYTDTEGYEQADDKFPPMGSQGA